MAWLWAPSSDHDPAAVGRFADPAMIITNALMVQTFFPQTFRTGISVARSLIVVFVLVEARGWSFSARATGRVANLGVVSVPTMVLSVAT